MTSVLLVDTIKNSLDSADTVAFAGGIHAPGSVIQVVSADGPNSEVIFTGSTFTDITLSATITPKFATSKILVKFNFVSATNNGSAGSYAIGLRILRDTTGIYENFRVPWGNSITGVGQVAHLEYVDSPATTNAITYKVQAKNGSGSGNVTAHMGNSNAQAILMEIAQ